MKNRVQRMCIICKGRYLQHELIRLQNINSSIVWFQGINRSFYICDICIDLEKTIKILASRFKIDKDKVNEDIREILANAKNSCK